MQQTLHVKKIPYFPASSRGQCPHFVEVCRAHSLLVSATGVRRELRSFAHRNGFTFGRMEAAVIGVGTDPGRRGCQLLLTHRMFVGTVTFEVHAAETVALADWACGVRPRLPDSGKEKEPPQENLWVAGLGGCG